MILHYLGAQSGHIAHLKARNCLWLETEDMEEKEKSERLAARGTGLAAAGLSMERAAWT